MGFKPGDWVRCMDAGFNPWLTAGKEYQVIGNTGIGTRIRRDRGNLEIFYTHRFEICDKQRFNQMIDEYYKSR